MLNIKPSSLGQLGKCLEQIYLFLEVNYCIRYIILEGAGNGAKSEGFKMATLLKCLNPFSSQPAQSPLKQIRVMGLIHVKAIVD